MDISDQVRAFVATVQTGSFTGAAERMGISNRLTSKYVAELEQRLGVRLLQRTTRKVGLTPAGEQLMARAPAWLDEMEEMLGAVSEETRGFSGTLRISAPVTFGEVFVTDLLRQFSAPHPELNVDLRLSDAYVDLAAAGIDLAFRVGTPTTSSVVARKLGEIRSVMAAAPAYLDRHGTPAHPEDLRTHACIVDTNRRTGTHWALHRRNRPEETASVDVVGRFMVNSARIARDLAVAGEGIVFAPEFILREDLKEGRLVPLLRDYDAPTSPLSVVYLEGARLPRKVRALIDFSVGHAKAKL
ncbi:LysR family transcriptional regulator [Pseudooceanicola nanhaiensis]|uniref:LysR family transcriptional regulator n=1 Tax=Pseudooceanicola nanhaiensis TaxID=375761 RepID=UPI001CD7FABA|nr:LysR family transcriptional regulator [Pseudooceanicola nanhaiensis]MCA0922324.1 LysR family transcriptional regulator [Pseudooceanicola nanhaiensis]